MYLFKYIKLRISFYILLTKKYIWNTISLSQIFNNFNNEYSLF